MVNTKSCQMRNFFIRCHEIICFDRLVGKTLTASLNKDLCTLTQLLSIL